MPIAATQAEENTIKNFQEAPPSVNLGAFWSIVINSTSVTIPYLLPSAKCSDPDRFLCVFKMMSLYYLLKCFVFTLTHSGALRLEIAVFCDAAELKRTRPKDNWSRRLQSSCNHWLFCGSSPNKTFEKIIGRPKDFSILNWLFHMENRTLCFYWPVIKSKQLTVICEPKF